MGSKDKESKTFQDKLKQFFKINHKQGGLKSQQKFVLTREMEQLLSQETPMSQRARAIKELSDALVANKYEQLAEGQGMEASGGNVREDRRKGSDRPPREKLTIDCVRSWYDIDKVRRCLADLFHRDMPKEARELAFHFYRSLVQGQYDKLGSMRIYIFEIIKTHDIAEDLPLRLELFSVLTEKGRDIEHLEDEMGAFMLDWMPEIINGGHTEEFLQLLVRLIKFNAAYIDEDEVTKIVAAVCGICSGMHVDPIISGCLQVLDTVVCYSNLPTHSLNDFVPALCRTVNMTFCASSWKIMRNLLGTHLGHAALNTLCRLLQNSDAQTDCRLLRGAVFFLNMGLWGPKKVPHLKCHYMSVLPSVLEAARSGHAAVVHEVVISCQRLVTKFGLDIHDPSWDLILLIIEESLKFCCTSSDAEMCTLIIGRINETFASIERLIELNQYNGSVQPFYELAEKCSPILPENSVLRLVKYLSLAVRPTNANWIGQLHSIVDKFYRQETRTFIRTSVLQILGNIVAMHRYAYEDELIDQIVVPHLSHAEQVSDVAVRSAVAQLLIDLCEHCETKKCLELLDILEKLFNLPYEQTPAGASNYTEADVLDIRQIACGLTRVFIVKLYMLPSCHANRMFNILVSHLENHYQQSVQPPTYPIMEFAPSIRTTILECFLNLRANCTYHLGYKTKGTVHDSAVEYSPYLIVDHKYGERGGTSSPTPVSPAPTPYPQCVVSSIALTKAWQLIISCLGKERDWTVLQMVLKEIPQILKNRALFSSRYGSDIDQMALALCSLINDKTIFDKLRNTPTKFPRSEFQGFIFPVLTALASYHTHLDSAMQQRLIVCLEYGLQSRFAATVVAALTTCTLEMKDAMYKRLPEVLLSLSKISATVHIAIPILSFLSTLTRLPKVFASFVGDQYMSVLAICLPYTNPFKYNHFTVSLAHHVIAAWFLKCRLPFRRDFVRFITMGLKANVIVPLEEGQLLKGDGRPDVVNEDSSNRKRSSSLTEQGSRRRPLGGPSRLETRPMDLRAPFDDALHNFHLELTETCVDLMARYTFSTCSSMPTRIEMVDSILVGGQSMTWLVGTKLVTVTTSGCNQKIMRMGLCDKCWINCRYEPHPSTPQDGSGQEGSHESIPAKLALQRSSSADVAPICVRDEAATGSASASASSSAGGSARSLSLLVQSSSTSGDTEGSLRSSAAINSPSEERRGLAASLDAMEPETSKLDQLLFGSDRTEGVEKLHCNCWCNGWAEIYVRRPTGDMSWAMRLQNRISCNDMSLCDMATLYLPPLEKRERQDPSGQAHDVAQEQAEGAGVAPAEQVAAVQSGPVSHMAQSEPVPIHPSPVRHSPSRQSSRDSLEEEEGHGGDSDIEDGGGRARNPVRRSNSSPEMSAGWRNPFLTAAAQDREKMDKITKPSYSKDLRANCEAIPEEIGGLGTTPPSTSPTVAKFPPSQPGTSSGGPTITSVSSPARAASFSPAGTVNPPTSSLLSKQGKSSATPLLLPSSLSSKPPLSPTQARHQASDAADPSDPRSKVATGRLPAELKIGLSNAPSRLSEMRLSASRLSSASGSDPTLGSSSSLESRAGLDAMHMLTSAPASPTTLQPYQLSASAELISRDEGASRPDPSSLPMLQFKHRDRGHTISVMSPVRKPPRSDWDAKRSKASTSSTPRPKETQRPSVNPIFVFLQLYHSPYFADEHAKPILVPNGPAFARSIKVLDCIQPYETHKVGVLYVGRGQVNNEVEILRNTAGSDRYTEFIERLGSLVFLQEADPHLFLGGLDTRGKDGKFAYIWQDDITQVTFHIATLMPTHDADPSCNDKKRHIGNNFVTIVYNESGEDFNMHTIKGQFNHAVVEIRPLDLSNNEVLVLVRDELKDYGVACDSKIVSDANLGILARQLALHASLASDVSRSLKLNSVTPYASNWLERLRKIKNLREKLMKEAASEENNSGPGSSSSQPQPQPPPTSSTESSGRRRLLMDDFTEYT